MYIKNLINWVYPLIRLLITQCNGVKNRILKILVLKKNIGKLIKKVQCTALKILIYYFKAVKKVK